jgi:hypothetical protein
LTGDYGGAPPWYDVMDDGSTEVVAFGCNYEVRVDHHGTTEVQARQLWNAAGCLFLYGTDWLLRLGPIERSGRYHPILYDIHQGQVCKSQVGQPSVFADWSIHLLLHENQPERFIEIARFSKSLT